MAAALESPGWRAKLSSRAYSIAGRLGPALPGLLGSRVRDPVFVVGFPNSGKSNISQALGRHPELTSCPHEGNSDLWFPGFFPWLESGIQIPPIWFDPDNFVAEWSRGRGEQLLRARATLGAYQLLSGGSRLINDSGMLAAVIARIAETFPDARILHVQRDPIVVSYLAAQFEWSRVMRAPLRYEDQGCPMEFPGILASMARYWKWTTSGVKELERSTPGRVLTVRYEDWCMEPEETMRGAMDFLGLSASAECYPTTPIMNLNDVVTNQIPKADLDIIRKNAGVPLPQP